MHIDYAYLCQGLGHLLGLEIRVIKNQEMVEHYTNFKFNPDISNLVANDINNTADNVFYIETDDLLLFGVIKSKSDNSTIIIGPTSQIRPNKQTMIAILYMLNEAYNRLPQLEEYFSNMVSYPFENFLEVLCFVNYAVNEEKLTVSDLIKKDVRNGFSSQTVMQTDLKETIKEPHNTFQAEKLMLSYVTSGNVEATLSFFTQPPTGRIGSIAHNELRQRKNIFVCAATLISRAAIAGGLSSEIAFGLSDLYIQKAEMLTASGDITALNMEMLLDYTKRVEALKCGNENSQLAKKVMRYVLKNISSKTSIDKIAEHLKMNRSHLCERFKMETGKTINDFISLSKIEEAKRMLEVTNLSIAQIGDFLAFSSQSYFQSVFKRIEGCTPKEYRSKTQTEQGDGMS